jgi:hypothetical protein
MAMQAMPGVVALQNQLAATPTPEISVGEDANVVKCPRWVKTGDNLYDLLPFLRTLLHHSCLHFHQNNMIALF